MDKDFDTWNKIKKDLENSSILPEYFPKKGEVWMTVLGQNLGFEQNGVGEEFLRPMMVIKKFNNHMFWCVPLSSKQKHFDFYFNFTDPENQSVSVILAQLRLVSIKRFQRKMYETPWEVFDAIKQGLRKFLD